LATAEPWLSKLARHLRWFAQQTLTYIGNAASAAAVLDMID
jgi:hypothetical protein